MQKPNTTMHIDEVEHIVVEDIQPLTTNGHVTGYMRIIRIQTAQASTHLYLMANQSGKIELVKAVERYEPLDREEPVDWLKPDQEDDTDPDDEPF